MHDSLELNTFKINRYSNNHGESWPRALAFVIFTSSLLYCIYYVCLFHHRSFAWSGIPNFLADYFYFLDPLHKIDFLVDKDKVNAGAKITDFFGQLTIGYGIYQFIAAFRRHGRKSA